MFVKKLPGLLGGLHEYHATATLNKTAYELSKNDIGVIGSLCKASLQTID